MPSIAGLARLSAAAFCILAVARAQGQSLEAQQASRDASLALALQLNAESERQDQAALQKQRIVEAEYNPEAAVAAGIRPSPPVLRLTTNPEDDAYNRQMLQRYGSALDAYNARVKAAESTAKRQPAEADPDSDAFKAATRLSQQNAIAIYPQSSDPNSALSKKMVEVANRLEAQNDDRVFSPNAPFEVARIAARELGIAPKP